MQVTPLKAQNQCKNNNEYLHKEYLKIVKKVINMLLMNVFKFIPAATVNVLTHISLPCKVLFSHIILSLNPVNTGFCGA
jgi:hypothetical protein